eukprot:958186-Rhodomonas_salina.1
MERGFGGECGGEEVEVAQMCGCDMYAGCLRLSLSLSLSSREQPRDHAVTLQLCPQASQRAFLHAVTTVTAGVTPPQRP